MIRRLVRSPISWIAGALLAAVVLYLALAVFGVQALFIDREVNETFDAPEKTEQSTPQSKSARSSGLAMVSSGRFHGVVHAGTGDAIVYRQEDGSHVLRLENLNVDNGPDLYVYAVATNDANDSGTVLDAGFVNVGKLKGNRGDQTYELPAGFDPETHRAISIWCQRFSVNFATAPLQRA